MLSYLLSTEIQHGYKTHNPFANDVDIAMLMKIQYKKSILRILKKLFFQLFVSVYLQLIPTTLATSPWLLFLCAVDIFGTASVMFTLYMSFCTTLMKAFGDKL